jgi:predicted RNA methylase
VLDVGCGQSRATLAVAAGGANRVVGTDQLEDMIDIA